METKKTITLLFLFFGIILNAQTNEYDTIDKFIETTLNNFKETPGLAITIIKDGKPFFTKAYGYADVENKIEAKPSTAYYIASTTKSFVGLLALQLAEEGILDLEKPITHYAPIKDFKDNSAFKDVTIKDLITHTSGIRNSHLTFRNSSEGEYSLDDMVRIMETKTINSYKKFRYDNLGYNVLDFILQIEFNLNWKDLLKDKILDPLKMNRTTAYLSKAEKNNWDMAQPYSALNDLELPKLVSTQKNDATMHAAGGLVSSIEDAQKWLLVNMNDGKLNGKQIFSKDIINKSHSLVAEYGGKTEIFENKGYGYGWNNAMYKEQKVIYHFGGFDGFFSHISFMPEKNIGIAVFTNEANLGDNASNLVASFAYDLLLGNISSTSDYKEQVDAAEKRRGRVQSSFSGDRAFRAKYRDWTLKNKFSDYIGEYYNPNLGTISITLKQEVLHAKLGIASSISSPAVDEDTIRVEFRDSRGSNILFVFDKNGSPHAAVYNGEVFYKKFE